MSEYRTPNQQAIRDLALIARQMIRQAPICGHQLIVTDITSTTTPQSVIVAVCRERVVPGLKHTHNHYAQGAN